MILNIKVKPNSTHQNIKKISETEYNIALKSNPENNKANLELIKLLKKYFKKPVKIKSGFTSKNKRVEICQ